MEMGQINNLRAKESPEKQVISACHAWLKDFVVELNLCPFAGKVLLDDSIRYSVCFSDNEEALLDKLSSEIYKLRVQNQIATTLLIHPNVLQDFSDYNQFLELVDGLLEEMDCVGEFQVASFHPDYQFANTASNDLENFTNRSPFPMLHVLREASITQAVKNYPNIHDIPNKNIQKMREIGSAALKNQLLEFKNRSLL